MSCYQWLHLTILWAILAELQDSTLTYLVALLYMIFAFVAVIRGDIR